MAKSSVYFQLLSTVLVIIWNYYTVAYGFNGNTVGELSAEYFNLFTPAPYAFSIWGIIFVGLIAISFFTVIQAHRDSGTLAIYEPAINWLTLANVLNALWVYAWLSEYTLFSVLIMMGILLSLMSALLNTDIHRTDASRSAYWLLEVPLSVYAGWIMVAMVANMSAYLAKSGWEALFGELTWALILITISTFLYLTVLWKQRSIPFACVGVWALIAIGVRHSDDYNLLSLVAWIGASVLGLAIIVQLLRSFQMNKSLN